MKKIVIGILISFVCSVCLASLLPKGNWASKLNTLYAISGIMFSIGMSLIVTSSFSKIQNVKIRKQFVNAFKNVRNSYLLEFLLVSVIYMIDNSEFGTFQFHSIQFSYPIFAGLMIIFSIIVFIVNFIELQTLNTKLDELINDD